jgi:UDP-3-O-[3-hydroxymyristoyl] glucosamine N-acyltransferase
VYILKPNKIYASEIAEFLNSRLVGEDFIVTTPCSLANMKKDCVTYVKNRDYLEKLRAGDSGHVLAIMPEESTGKQDGVSIILSKTPRLDFIKVIQEFFIDEMKHEISGRAIIEKGAILGKNVAIGANSLIGSEVKIMDNTIIGTNVVIQGKVDIGKNCVIKDNSTIGSEGFGFEYDEDIPLHFPQIGKITIGNNVWIGSNSTIERPALDETILEDHVKVDDLVQIGHHCVVGEGSLITAGTILCGGVKIGKKCWISPNVTIIQRVKVGDGALVGMGSVVLKDVEPGTVIAGNPAKFIHNVNETKGRKVQDGGID